MRVFRFFLLHVGLCVRIAALLLLFFSPHLGWWWVNCDLPGATRDLVRLAAESSIWLILPLVLFRFRVCARMFWLVALTYPFEWVHIYITHSYFTTGTMRSMMASNAGEATELMFSAVPVFVAAFALPVFYFFLVRPPVPDLRRWKWKWALLLIPFSVMVASEVIDRHRSGPSYVPLRNTALVLKNTPPANFFSTAYRALVMEHQIRKQQKGYDGFSYQARHLGDPLQHEVYVVVIGESARYGNFGINGYERNTTPILSTLDRLLVFHDMYTTANCTLYSFPLMLTRFTADEFDLAYSEKSLVSAFREAGFSTFWISNQGLLSDANSAFIMDIDQLYDFSGYQNQIYDEVVLPCLDEILEKPELKKVVFVNLMGNHVAYQSRHPRDFNVFRPSLSDGPRPATSRNREYFVNSYDNSVLYQDFILSEIIRKVEAESVQSFVLYFADHAESLFDQGSDVFGHTADPPLREQLHVPFFLWTSGLYEQAYPEKMSALQNHTEVPLSMDHLYFTLLDMAAIGHRFEQKSMSFADTLFVPPMVRKAVAPSGNLELFQ